MAGSEHPDRDEILDRLALMSEICDTRAWGRLPEVMAPDVVAYGASGIEAVVRENLDRYLGGCGPSQHLLGNHRVAVAGETAGSTCEARVFHQGKGEREHLTWECFGTYRDRWVRTADGWRMTERVFDVRAAVGDFSVLQPG
jgi:hypothetical protein